MKEVFYGSIALQKDLEFCEIMHELHKNSGVLLLSEPECVIVHEMQNVAGVLKDAGKQHIGYSSHYVTFSYRGFLFYVQPASYYPFTDINHPGRFCFIAYRRVGLAKKIQCSYFETYDSLESIIRWVDTYSARLIREVVARSIDNRISENDVARIRRFVKSFGGEREKQILRESPLFLSSETWNDEHKVVRVISDESDFGGHRDSFEFDIVTNRICG